MKFVTFYVLTFLIVWEIAGGGEFSQQDLHYIAARLNPLECSKILKGLPGIEKNERKHKTEFEELSEFWESDRSQSECFESLYECNERGKKGGCTKKWLVAALYKFGRADLAAGLKKRWKKLKSKKNHESQTKHKATQTQSLRARKTDDERKNNRSDTAKNIVKSAARRTSNTIESELKADNIFLDNTLVIFVAAASFFILGFLATILFVAYRRACRCFKNYEEHHLQKEEKPSSHEPLTKDFGICTNTIPDVIEDDPAKVVKCTKFALESERLEFEDEGFFKNSSGPVDSEYTKDKFLKSIGEPGVTRCQPEEKKSKRKMSPCARIKRFIDSQKRRSLRSEKDKDNKKRKRKKKCNEKMRGKNEDVGKICAQAEKGKNKNVQRNFKTHSSPRNREKRGKKCRTHEKNVHRSKLIGCTCDMCRLFNVKDEQEFIDRTNNLREPYDDWPK